jgi:hypothetical protein
VTQQNTTISTARQKQTAVITLPAQHCSQLHAANMRTRCRHGCMVLTGHAWDPTFPQHMLGSTHTQLGSQAMYTWQHSHTISLTHLEAHGTPEPHHTRLCCTLLLLPVFCSCCCCCSPATPQLQVSFALQPTVPHTLTPQHLSMSTAGRGKRGQGTGMWGRACVGDKAAFWGGVGARTAHASTLTSNNSGVAGKEFSSLPHTSKGTYVC